jgi:hypothetical protein
MSSKSSITPCTASRLTSPSRVPCSWMCSRTSSGGRISCSRASRASVSVSGLPSSKSQAIRSVNMLGFCTDRDLPSQPFWVRSTALCAPLRSVRCAPRLPLACDRPPRPPVGPTRRRGGAAAAAGSYPSRDCPHSGFWSRSFDDPPVFLSIAGLACPLAIPSAGRVEIVARTHQLASCRGGIDIGGGESPGARRLSRPELGGGWEVANRWRTHRCPIEKRAELT